MIDLPIRECQFIGQDQDPLVHHPIKYCGQTVIEGKSYCHDHYYRVYQKGTAIAGRKKERAIDAEIAALAAAQEKDDE